MTGQRNHRNGVRLFRLSTYNFCLPSSLHLRSAPCSCLPFRSSAPGPVNALQPKGCGSSSRSPDNTSGRHRARRGKFLRSNVDRGYIVPVLWPTRASMGRMWGLQPPRFAAIQTAQLGAVQECRFCTSHDVQVLSSTAQAAI